MSARALAAELSVTGSASCAACGWEVRWIVSSVQKGIIEVGDVVVWPANGSAAVIHVGEPSEHVLLRSSHEGHVYAVERLQGRAAFEVDPCGGTTPAPRG